MNHDENKYQDWPNGKGTRIVTASRSPQSRGRRRKRNSAIGGDIFRELPDGRFDATVVISLDEKRTHETASVAGAGVGDNRLEAIADFNSISALRRGHEQQHATIFFFAADAELFEKVVAILIDVFAIERTDGDDGHLRSGFLLDLQAKIFEAGFGVGIDDLREIRDVARGVDVFYVFGWGEEGGGQEEEKSEEARIWKSRGE